MLAAAVGIHAGVAGAATSGCSCSSGHLAVSSTFCGLRQPTLPESAGVNCAGNAAS